MFEDYSLTRYRELLPSLLQRVWRDAFWSLSGNILTVLSGLATLKIVGRLVAASEYGSASLVLGLCALLNQFISGPLYAEQIRQYFEHVKAGGTRTLFALLQGIALRTSTLISVLYLLIASAAFFAGQSTYLRLILPVVVLIYAQPLLTAAYAQFEAVRNYRMLSLVQPMANVLQVPLLVLLLAALSSSTAIVLAQALAGCVVLAIIRSRLGPSGTDAEPASTARFSPSSFTWGLYVFTLTSWVMATSDRYLVDYFVSRRDVGIYVINYAFTAIPFTILNGWITIFSRPRLYARAADRAWDRVARVVLGNLAFGAGLAVAGTVLFFFFGKPLALLVFGEQYWHSRELMIWIAAAHIFYVIGHTCSAYFLALKSFGWVWSTSLLAAAANLVVNIIVLPRVGIVGAAMATLIGYSLWAGMMLLGFWITSRRLAASAPTGLRVAGEK